MNTGSLSRYSRDLMGFSLSFPVRGGEWLARGEMVKDFGMKVRWGVCVCVIVISKEVRGVGWVRR